MPFRLLFVFLGVFFLLPIPASAQDPTSFIIVHAHNPEGVEINSIRDRAVDGAYPFDVNIYDENNNWLHRGIMTTDEHDKPIPITAGNHSIKVQFNGMELVKDIQIAPGETQVLVYEFPRTSFPIRDWALSIENLPPRTFSWEWPVYFNPGNFPVGVTQFTNWWVQTINRLGPTMTVMFYDSPQFTSFNFHLGEPYSGVFGEYYYTAVTANTFYNFAHMELPYELTTDLDSNDPEIRVKYRDRCREYIENSITLLYMSNVPFDFIGNGVKDDSNQPPTPVIDFTPISPIINSPITFDASGSYDTDGSITAYSWDFGDGSTGLGPMATHQFAQKGFYNIKLAVADDQGNSNYLYKVIYVADYSISFHDIHDPEKEVVGAVADGTSRILVKYAKPAIKHCPIDSDSLLSEGDGQWETGWTLTNNYCYRFYKAPLAYTRNSHPEDRFTGNRPIGMTINIDGQEAIFGPIHLYRAPIVLMHGLWDDLTTWVGFHNKLKFEYNFPFIFLQSYPHAVYFNQNMFVPKIFALNALSLPRNLKIAAEKVDIIGHSMGGLLTKLFGQESYIRTITTVGTPHYGSPLADILWMMVDEVETNPLEAWIAYMFNKHKHPATLGAVFNLKEEGGTHCDYDKIPVPTKTITGISNLTNQNTISFINWLSNLFKLNGLIGATADILSVNQYIFKNERNDWIVAESSQEGGAGDLAIDVNTLWHVSEPDEGEIQNSIIDFLNQSSYQIVISNKNSKYPSKINRTEITKNPSRPTLIKDAPTGYVQISSPVSGQIFAPGDEVAVMISTSNPSNIIFVSSQTLDSAFYQNEPYNFKFKIPNNWIGPLSIDAGALNENGYIGSSEISINVVPSANLSGFELYPQVDPFLMVPGSSLPFKLIGSFDDGIERDITFLPGKTIYHSSNPDVVEVSESGMMTAKALGQSLITINNSGISKTILIKVEASPPTNIYLPLILR